MRSKTHYNYGLVLLVFSIFCQTVAAQWFTRQTVRRPHRCAPYIPKINLDNYLNTGECRQRVGKVIRIPEPRPPTTVEEIHSRGYNVSTHQVISEDGYITAHHRISGCFKSPPRKGKRAVLLTHGGASGSSSWIIQPESRNLAFLLADAGYEVWLANLRGTIASKNHMYLDADFDLKYWDFSVDEMAMKDLPLLVDLMLETTGTDQIYSICHSLGCSVNLGGLAVVPELNNKIKAVILLAPAAWVGSSTNAFYDILAGVVETPLKMMVNKILGGRVNAEHKPMSRALGFTFEAVCTWTSIRCGVCDNLLFALFGTNPLQLNITNLPTILRKLQDNMGLKVLAHASQNFESCRFQRYDYGWKRNMMEYGNAQPPIYDLGKMTVPAFIFYGEADLLITPADVERLRDKIPPNFMKGFYKVEWPLFSHLDFCIANDADKLVYSRILNIINEMESKENVI